ncbi:hypothetical protein SAMN04488061_2834 [Filomicrobium insigne]|uniref:Uncharacterized protein n=1 Tax=Filomicrobium insigne TaxID=418854 RepID=A0A1H0SCC8_9HYPH|nr:hypothetical protein [Filomicrobium insigne]SDP39414.1 hypothetical protein SAMN04488061_2834 [Filomicrobium insigne]
MSKTAESNSYTGEDWIHHAAEILMQNVNAPEDVIYRAARMLRDLPLPRPESSLDLDKAEFPLGDGPRRRIVMIAKIDADDWDSLQVELLHLTRELARHGRLSTSSISGGYSTGHIIVTSEDGSIDHDSWAAELHAYLKTITVQQP